MPPSSSSPQRSPVGVMSRPCSSRIRTGSRLMSAECLRVGSRKQTFPSRADVGDEPRRELPAPCPLALALRDREELLGAPVLDDDRLGAEVRLARDSVDVPLPLGVPDVLRDDREGRALAGDRVALVVDANVDPRSGLAAEGRLRPSPGRARSGGRRRRRRGDRGRRWRRRRGRRPPPARARPPRARGRRAGHHARRSSRRSPSAAVEEGPPSICWCPLASRGCPYESIGRSGGRLEVGRYETRMSGSPTPLPGDSGGPRTGDRGDLTAAA